MLISTWGYGGTPLAWAIALLLLLSAYLGLFPGLAAAVLQRLAPLPGARDDGGDGEPTVCATVVHALWLWPACWLFAEFARDTIFNGFPWFSLGYVATDIPGGLSLAAVLGVHGVSAVYALVAVALACLLAGSARLLAVLCLSVVLGLHLCLPSPAHWTQPVDGDPVNAVLIQGNIPQDKKWLPENRFPTVELYQQMTAQAWPADLVIWPEVAIPLPYAYVEWLFQEQDDLARKAGGSLYAGILTQQNGHNYNTVYALGEDSGRYVKRHLVPFGEYIPAPDWVKPMFDVLSLPFPSIATGMQGQRTLSVNGHTVSMSICFEDVFPQEVRETSTSSAFLVNVTNDAWFAGSAAPEQHLQIARLRAAESGRSLLRVANTGISAVIGPNGEVQQRLDWGVRGSLRAEVIPRQGLTPYQRWGRLPLNLYVLTSLLLALLLGRRLLP